MGWRGAVRSLTAVARAAERDAQRRRRQADREFQKRQKHAAREQMVGDAAQAVQDWNSYVKQLVSIHVGLTDAIDWRSIAETPAPRKPKLENTHQLHAKVNLQTFKPPGRLARLLGKGKYQKTALELAVREAPAKDNEAYQKALARYEEQFLKWEAKTDMARRLIAGDQQAMLEAIEEMQTLPALGLIGVGVRFDFDGGKLHAKPEVHGDDIIPDFRRKQLVSGKLSETKMPIGQFNELYQDYVISVALKVAGDMFQILPIDEVYVTCEAKMLDSSTGHMRMAPILSVQFVRQTFEAMNLTRIDPSDSMRNFNHRMDFKKTRGFNPVDALG